ncbi:MAG: nucleoside-diphosphate kinase [Actinobacteria bacterium]|nr:nucleoside-diphosphate kinase [Actinomycetota bacterium]
MSSVEQTFVMIKPDGVRKGLTGEIISRFERRGLVIEKLLKKTLKREEAEELYSVHRERNFFEELVNYVTSGPVVLMVVSGPSAVSVVRKMLGATDPKEALPGTIRGDFALDISENIIHGSDSLESAEREISIFF